MTKEIGPREKQLREQREARFEENQKRLRATLRTLRKSSVDTSDIPEEGEDFFKKAKLRKPPQPKKKKR